MLANAATIRTLTKVVDGTGFVFAYNYTNRPTPARFTWRHPPARVLESRDGRLFAVTDSSWEDTFSPSSRTSARYSGLPSSVSACAGALSTPPKRRPTQTVTACGDLSATAGNGPICMAIRSRRIVSLVR